MNYKIDKSQTTPIVNYAPKNANRNRNKDNVDKVSSWVPLMIKAVIAVVLFTLVLTYVITPIPVSGISMQPTLHNGDVMLVFKWPQTWARLTGTQYIPSRTNIVIIAKNSVSNEELIKRVIALPGEKVVISNNNLTVYNQNYPNGFDPNNAKCCRNLLQPSGTFSTVVPNGEIFAMGDNRNPGASIDSRSSIGNIQSNQIVGKVLMRIYPFDKIKFF